MVPNPLAVNEGDYPYTRALRLYTRKAAQSPAAKEFIRFVESSTGQQLVRKAGFAGRMDPRMQNSLGD
jgi:ABC-type phosphate transport system substrate-binding protein